MPTARVCSVADCGRPHVARGFCRPHYHANWVQAAAEWRAQPKVNVGSCSIADCEKPARTCGWCHMHYQRSRVAGMTPQARTGRKPPPMECTKCGGEKHRNASGKLYCKACAASLGKAYRAKNAARLRELAKSRYLRDRDRRLELFRANYRANREFRDEQARQWRKDHPALVRRYKQKWASSNLERGREYAGRRRALYLAAVCEHGPDCVSADVYRDVQARQCLYCDKPAEHADHYIPLTRGGLHCADNIVPACKVCNLSKNNRMPDEWLAPVMPA